MAVSAGCEIAYRRFHVPFLASRKIAHIAGSIISFFLPYLMSNTNAVGMGFVFTFVLFVSKKNYILKSIHDEKGASIGEILYPLGLTLSALIIWPFSILAYQGSCLVLGVSDGLAGYLGNRHGKRNYSAIGGSKTIEGSIIFFVFTAIIFCGYYFLYATHVSLPGIALLLLYTLAVTFAEAVFSGGWDNVIIPVAAGSALLLIVS